MNKQEIQDEIRATREKLEALEAKLKEPEKWKPKGGDWLVGMSGGEFLCFCDSWVIKSEANARFETEDEAKQACKHLNNQLILFRLANDLNGDWVADWSDSDQTKFMIVFNFEYEEWSLDYLYYCNFAAPVFSEPAAKKALEILKNQDIGIKL